MRVRHAQVTKAAVAVLLAITALAVTACGMPVPGVLGMTADDAAKELRRAGFRIGTIDYAPDSTGAIGEVVAQDPAEGRLAKDNAGIDLTVAGEPPVAAPDVAGMDKAELDAALDAAGFELGAVNATYDNTITAGLVISQKPKAGSSAQPGSEVEVVMSQGPKPIGMPKVVRMTLAKAMELLEDRKFKVEVVESKGAYAPGTVMSQNPAPGVAVQPGDTVKLVVSTGARR